MKEICSRVVYAHFRKAYLLCSNHDDALHGFGRKALPRPLPVIRHRPHPAPSLSFTQHPLWPKTRNKPLVRTLAFAPPQYPCISIEHVPIFSRPERMAEHTEAPFKSLSLACIPAALSSNRVYAYAIVMQSRAHRPINGFY